MRHKLLLITSLSALILLGAKCSGPATTGTAATPTPAPTAPAAITIAYGNSGFNPSTATIKTGDTVVFKNESSSPMWPASAPHPSHTDYPAFDAKQGIAPGQRWAFTFTKVGSWKFHDHLNPDNWGAVIVR